MKITCVCAVKELTETLRAVAPALDPRHGLQIEVDADGLWLTATDRIRIMRAAAHLIRCDAEDPLAVAIPAEGPCTIKWGEKPPALVLPAEEARTIMREVAKLPSALRVGLEITETAIRVEPDGHQPVEAPIQSAKGFPAWRKLAHPRWGCNIEHAAVLRRFAEMAAAVLDKDRGVRCWVQGNYLCLEADRAPQWGCRAEVVIEMLSPPPAEYSWRVNPRYLAEALARLEPRWLVFEGNDRAGHIHLRSLHDCRREYWIALMEV